MKTRYTILKGYRVFEGEAVGEPMDEPSEQNLYAWLCNRGLSDDAALSLIRRVDQDGVATVDIDFLP